MKGIWTAPYEHIQGIKDWSWPVNMHFEEWYTFPRTWYNFDYDVWFCNPSQNFVIDVPVLSHMPRLQLIVTPSTGKNHINEDVCRERGIAVLGLLDERFALESIRASSEFAFLMIMNSLRRYDKFVIKDQFWRRDDNEMRGNELCGKTVGLIGYGRIGQNLARWLDAFGADVWAYDPYVDVFQTPIEQIFAECDIIVIACELTAETRSMIGVRLLSTMQRGARLVNIARGEVIDEVGLVSTLRARPDLTFVSDVIVGETTDDHRTAEILKLPNAAITPHIGGTTYESQEKAARIAMWLSQEYIYGERKRV